jgi:hypothetical protein
MAKTLVGRAETPEHAQRILRELLDAGFNRADIGLVSAGPHSELAGTDHGGAVITVETYDDEMTTSARDIMQKHGALEARQ